MNEQTGLKPEHAPASEAPDAVYPDFVLDGTEAPRRCGEYMVSCGVAASGFAARIQRLADHAADAWLLPVAFGAETIEIGPLLGGSNGNCYRCWHDRRIAATPQGQYLRHLLEKAGPVSPLAIIQVLVQHIIRHFASWSDAATHPLRRAVWIYRLLDGVAMLHRSVPAAECHCPAYTGEPADAKPAWSFAPKLGPYEYRTRPLSEIGDEVSTRFLDAAAGPVQSLNVNLSFPACAVAMAEVEIEVHGRRELGCGAAADYQTARHVAMLEALERYAGHLPRGRPQAVMCAPDDAALVPLKRFGLHDPGVYQSELLEWPALDVPVACVRGHSLTRKSDALLDEQLVYYSAWKARGQARRVVEISNGCALGAAPEECIFHGLLEIIERDAFLAAWYRQRIPDRVAVGDIDDPLFQHQKVWCESLGYALTALDLRTETGIPVVMLVLRGGMPDLPAFQCSVSAHPVPERAVAGAMDELIIALTKQRDLMRTDPGHIARLAENPADVRQMDDHALRFCSQEAAGECDFLLEGDKTLAPDSLREMQGILSGHDLHGNLQTLVDALELAGLEVLTVNQTPPSFAAAGLHVFKTLVPGMLPMTFGRHLRRVRGIERLDSLPDRLGGTWLRRAPDAVNPLPHPFP